METEAGSYGFKKDFEHDGLHYSMQVIPFILAKEEDKKAFHLQEGQFLIHLFDGTSFQSFSVYYNDGLQWDSNASKLVLDDKDLVERIGFLIDDYYA